MALPCLVEVRVPMLGGIVAGGALGRVDGVGEAANALSPEESG